jgi:hypothetical protein
MGTPLAYGGVQIAVINYIYTTERDGIAISVDYDPGMFTPLDWLIAAAAAVTWVAAITASAFFI